ncbi:MULTISPECIES: hypothetical protein [unclassified Exiguobacterium]|uniref:hypothetical protein n=1 Tax=unclassified Exiguobacterium TaxID=2644629 RepID=UPI0025B893AA|nr:MULTISPECIES: hypothetical protein [unclassified Exiguobacterium]
MNYIQSENQIVSLFPVGSSFIYDSQSYITLTSGKPLVARGEPKCDIYVLARTEDTSETKEFKISYKKINADFLENKMSDTRALQIFGADWSNRIQRFTNSIQQAFEERTLISYTNSGARTRAGSILLGWKFEILNKPGGELSSEIYLHPREILEVYAGRLLGEEKRNALVNGRIIPNSGVADYILIGDCESYLNPQDVIDNMLPIEEYAVANPRLFFACKAHNYNTFREKMDGNRYLSVYVDWTIVHERLTPTLVFNEPLITRANSVKDRLLESLSMINAVNTEQLNENNVSPIRYIRR